MTPTLIPIAPPPIPPPTPSPNQTFVVTTPPDVLEKLSDVVEKLAPHESGLSQPWATVLAAFLAILAAGVAYLGVLNQVRGTARQAQEERSDKARKDLRAECFRLLHSVSDQTLTVERDAFALSSVKLGNQDVTHQQNDLNQKYFEVMLLRDELTINNLTKSADELLRFIQQANAAEHGNATPEAVENRRSTMLFACRQEIKELLGDSPHKP
jgi:hypothetical protein